MKWDKEQLRQVIDAAQGRIPADLCIRNCRIVNVLTGRIEDQDLAIHSGFIAGWGNYSAHQEIDAQGMYVAPGFIDGHIHIESTLLSPREFSHAVVPWGTTAVVADPHEIANVLGLDGIRYFLESTQDLPLDVFLNLPSCVPASPLETSGAHLKAMDLYSLIPHERILGLAEMMNFPGVLLNTEEVTDKLLLFQNCVLDGHAPMLGGLPLNAYLASGIASDHECTSFAEAEEKLAKGMFLMIREGSQSKDMEELIPAVTSHTWPRCMLVSDDRHPDDLMGDGHMNFVVNRAMSLGMDPVLAIKLSSYTPSRYFALQRRGALAPGYLADLSMSPSLKPWIPLRVFKAGREVARDGRLLPAYREPREIRYPHSPMEIQSIEPDALQVAAHPGLLRTIGIVEESILTKKMLVSPRIDNGRVVTDPERDILKLVVFNRYKPRRKPSVGFVHGMGLKRGAIASTVAHDSHNLMAAGVTDEAILQVVNRVIESGGGMAIGEEANGIDILPLPLAGLMSDMPLKQVVHSLGVLKQRAKAMGSSLKNPFMALSFLALPVIPELKLTDLGLVDVSTFSFVSLFESA